MSAHPAPRATRAIRAETAGSSGLALGPNQRGKGGGEVEASIPVTAMAHQRTRARVRRRASRNLAAAHPSHCQLTDIHPLRTHFVWSVSDGFALRAVVGIDKYFDNLVEWKQYLWAGIPDDLHISADGVMHIAGVLEITAGLLVLFAPRIGSAPVALWLAAVTGNLLLV